MTWSAMQIEQLLNSLSRAEQAYRDNLTAIDARLTNLEQAVINQTLLLERIGVQLAQLRTVLHA